MKAGDIVGLDAEKLDAGFAVETLVRVDQTERLVFAARRVQNVRNAEFLQNCGTKCRRPARDASKSIQNSITNYI